MRRILPNEVVSIATGGISTLEEIASLADEGCVCTSLHPLFHNILIIPTNDKGISCLSVRPRYDAVVLGKALVSSGDPCQLIKKARHRQGLPRKLLGLGLRAEDLEA